MGWYASSNALIYPADVGIVRDPRPSVPCPNHHRPPLGAVEGKEAARHPLLSTPCEPVRLSEWIHVAVLTYRRSFTRSFLHGCAEMDFVGLLLVAASLALILLPLGLAPRATRGWRTPSMVCSSSPSA